MGRTVRPQVALYLDPEKVEQLDKLATKTGETKQALLRRAVNLLLEDYELVRRRTADSGRLLSALRRKRRK